MHPTEIEIDWEAFVSGDEQVFELVYDAFFNPLYNYGRKFTVDSELIEDAIQDLFIRFWKNRTNLNKPVSLRNYLFKAFRNHLIDRLKASGRYVLGDGDHLELDTVQSVEQVKIALEIDHAKSLRLTKAMQQLTERQKEAVFLRFYESFSYEEIAETMDITIKATYKLMARSIDAMRSALNEGGIKILFILLRVLSFQKSI